MEQNGFMKIFSIVAFAALMVISCWATTTSLHLLLPEWPVFIFWVVTIVFFVLSSLGTKLIVDACNKYVDTEHPGRNIAGGIIILLLFWVIFSIPTNTHTFFYKSTIKDVLIQDLANTKSHLKDLSDDQTAKRIIDADKSAYIANVDAKLHNLKTEIMREENRGDGPLAAEAKIELEKALGNGTTITKRAATGTSKQALKTLCDNYAEEVERIKQIRIKEKYDARLEAITSHKDKKEIDNNIKAITAIEKKIKEHPEKNDVSTVATNNVLTRSYVIIANYMDYLKNEFSDDHKSEVKGIEDVIHQYKTNVTQTQKMRSVIDVWKGLFAGDPIYKGRGLWFWVILAIMVDVAGFIFFDIAFRKREY